MRITFILTKSNGKVDVPLFKRRYRELKDALGWDNSVTCEETLRAFLHR